MRIFFFYLLKFHSQTRLKHRKILACSLMHYQLISGAVIHRMTITSYSHLKFHTNIAHKYCNNIIDAQLTKDTITILSIINVAITIITNHNIPNDKPEQASQRIYYFCFGINCSSHSFVLANWLLLRYY